MPLDPMQRPSWRLRHGRRVITLIRSSRNGWHSHWLHNKRGCGLLSVPPALQWQHAKYSMMCHIAHSSPSDYYR